MESVLLKLLRTGTLLLTCSACSSLLYYPSREQFVNPESFGYNPVDVELRADDGVKLHAWHFPSRKKGPAKGLVVVFHGNAENISSHALSTLWLTDEGYELFAFDYRGYGKSEGRPSPEGTVLDGLAALRWARARKLPVIVYGQSLGSAVSLRSTIELSPEFRPVVIVLESGFLSYKSVGRSILAKHWLTWAFQWIPYVVLSDSMAPHAADVKALSPVPLYVIHSLNDPIVSIYQGRQIFAAATQPKDMLEIPEPGHIVSFHVSRGRHRPWLLEHLREATAGFSIAPLQKK